MFYMNSNSNLISHIESKKFIAVIAIVVSMLWAIVSFLHVNKMKNKGYTNDCDISIKSYNIVIYIQFGIIALYATRLFFNVEKVNYTNINLFLIAAIIQGLIAICLNGFQWSTLYKLQNCKEVKNDAHQWNSFIYLIKIINIISLVLSVVFMLGMLLIIQNENLINSSKSLKGTPVYFH